MRQLSVISCFAIVSIVGIGLCGWYFLIIVALFGIVLVLQHLFPRKFDLFSYYPYVHAPDGKLYSRREYCELRLRLYNDWDDIFPEITEKILREREMEKEMEKQRRKRIIERLKKDKEDARLSKEGD